MELSPLLKEILLAYLLIFAVLIYDLKNDLGIGRELALSAGAALLQLFLIGFVILYLLKVKEPLLNLSVVLIMSVNAAWIAASRFKLRAYSRAVVFALAFVAIAAVNYFLLLLFALAGVVRPDANVLIPFAGLLLAAGMRALSLFSQYAKDLLLREAELLEAMAALGAGVSHLRSYLIKKAVPLTTVVIRDMLKAAGIVHVPGVMVGLLMAGTPPLEAAATQFLVLASMLFSMFFTPIVFYHLLTALRGVKLEPPP